MSDISNILRQIPSVTEHQHLSDDVLDQIENLLIKKEDGGYERGLFTKEQLVLIRQKLIDLAAWLEQNKPEFLEERLNDFSHHDRFDETTTLCISYVDHIEVEKTEHSAKALISFFNDYLSGLYSHLHILPHFPSPVIDEGVRGPASRADGGFEAKNFQMDPKYGSPEDLKEVKAEVMLDFVVNHLSSKGLMFNKFMENEEGFENFFVTIPKDKVEDIDLTPVFRPREHYPIVEYTNTKGESKYVWCTFSETQADINIKDPVVFCKMMETLVVDFIGQGASWIRLDAVGYLVKMLGLSDKEALTDCFGIEETHNILKAIRLYTDAIAPPVTLVPEVNARGDVINTYYGDNNNEGHMAYEFPSAPLSIFTIYAEDASAILHWADKRTESPERIGLAFTNSHDGIGVLPMADVANMVDGTPALQFLLYEIERRGGGINYKSKFIDGESKRIPYEACITWLQAVLSPPEKAALMGNRIDDANFDLVAARYMASQSFIYSAPHCVPADYMGVVTGLMNDEALYERAGHRRNKNRGLVNRDMFEKALNNPETAYEKLRQTIFYAKRQMLLARQETSAFSPYAECTVDVVTVKEREFNTNKPVYSVLRKSPHNEEQVLALTNCSPRRQDVLVPVSLIPNNFDDVTCLLDSTVDIEQEGDNYLISLKAYQVAWLKI